MKIEDSIKIKLLALYLGCRWMWRVDKRGFISLHLTDINTIGNPEYKDKEILLVLKSVSAITDNEAIEVAILSGIDRSKAESIEAREFAIKHGKSISLSPNPSAIIYQYLQSKGYDLPQYLLGGKTLEQAGLAIYEKIKS